MSASLRYTEPVKMVRALADNVAICAQQIGELMGPRRRPLDDPVTPPEEMLRELAAVNLRLTRLCCRLEDSSVSPQRDSA